MKEEDYWMWQWRREESKEEKELFLDEEKKRKIRKTMTAGSQEGRNTRRKWEDKPMAESVKWRQKQQISHQAGRRTGRAVWSCEGRSSGMKEKVVKEVKMIQAKAEW